MVISLPITSYSFLRHNNHTFPEVVPNLDIKKALADLVQSVQHILLVLQLSPSDPSRDRRIKLVGVLVVQSSCERDPVDVQFLRDDLDEVLDGVHVRICTRWPAYALLVPNLDDLAKLAAPKLVELLKLTLKASWRVRASKGLESRLSPRIRLELIET